VTFTADGSLTKTFTVTVASSIDETANPTVSITSVVAGTNASVYQTPASLAISIKPPLIGAVLISSVKMNSIGMSYANGTISSSEPSTIYINIKESSLENITKADIKSQIGTGIF
jgi:hypothetical protein